MFEKEQARSRTHTSAIRNLVAQALATGFLSTTAEEHLRLLMAAGYDLEDFRAIMDLQYAAERGQVLQESRLKLGVSEAVAVAQAS
ncbi:MAG: hypothetical protein MH825_08900 [Cyanobacteria bacterium]|nr:hypothetical protein [Cyanobacteriota bacterium]